MKSKQIFVVLSLGFLLLTGCTNYEETYKLLKQELKETQELKSNYFAQYFDLNELNQAEKTANEVIKNSDKEKYEATLSELEKQNSDLDTFINSEQEKLYNIPTGSTEYPFAVDLSELPIGWSAESIKKQTSSHPLRIDVYEPDYIDESPDVYIWIKSSSHKYSYEIHNIDTKEIIVQDENGEKEKALVNTEIQFIQKDQHPVNITDDTIKNQRPGYLFKDRDKSTILALQNYDGEEYYVLYKANQ